MGAALGQSDADLMGKYKVPTSTRRRGEQGVYRAGRPDDVPAHVVLLDNLIYFGMGRRRDLTASSRSPCRWAVQSLRASPQRTSANAPTAFSSAAEMIGKTVGIAGDHLTGEQMATALGKALGKPVGYNAVTPEAYRGFGFPAEDLGNMFQFYRDFESYFCGARDLGWRDR